MANIKFTNFAHSLLAVGIGPGDTSISVTGGHGARFPALGAGEYFYATLEDASNNREIVKVTARASDVFTVVRAQDNTAALSWNAGDTIALRLNAAALEVIRDSSAIDFVPAGTGAVATNVQSKLREFVSVKDFGAVGDGVTNDTAAINAALTHASASKLQVRFPAGTYLYDGGGVLGAGVVVVGDGRNSTTIRSRLASPTSGFLFNASGYGAGVRGMYFDAAVTQTSGSYVWLTGPESFLDDFHITNDYNGVLMTGNVARIRHGRFQDGASGAIRIRAEGGDNSQLIDDVLMGAQSPQVSTAGIRVRNSSALIISNTSIIQQGHCLLVDPYSNTPSSTDSGSVFSLFVNNCFFDNAGGNAIRIAPTGNASVVRCRFANVWANSAVTDNVYINNAGTGIVQGMHFESCHALLSPGSGFSLTGTLSDIVINGGEICQNAFGVYVNNAVTNLRVTNATIGSGAGLSGNTGYGIQFAAGAAASNQIVIANNTMVGNGAGAIDVSAVTGTSVSVYGNFGDNARSFTPTISFATPGNLAVTYAAQFGTFRRVGDMVIATFTVATSAFTHTTASGNLVIGGLPYVAAAGSEGALEVQGITKAGYSQFTLNLSAGASSMNVRGSGSGVAIANVTAADMPSGGSVTLRGTIMYLV